ncbi:sensor histidine kinase [Pseudogemmobacter bohemicus]|uniref:sensor histidine kinase n=1 Tax=Pseudogemmobacter bohemicus TaxID=2250708 RepID=UPI000DD417DF|nr:HAMP domain-containing sensor histidine kinase [Pseudogemmobacter bohemicus]
MTARQGSLISRLSRRLILLQLLALMLVVAVASIPEPGRRGVYQLDEDVLTGIAANLMADGNRLYVPEHPDLLARIANWPDFWFMVSDSSGRRGEYGPVPDEVRRFFQDAGSLVEVEIYHDSDRATGSIIGSRMDTRVGTVTILTGGGPTLSPVIGRLKEIDPWYLAVLAIVITVLALGIPWLVRRDLAGVARVADEAARIDIDRPGTRLTEANVPPELQAMMRAMNAALTRLDEGMERRRRFLSTAAHELRTPVTVLMMRVELLPPGPERRQLMLDVARLSALAGQLLDLDRLDHDQTAHQRLDLAGLLRETMAEIAPLAVAARADLSLQLPPGPVTIMGDRQAMQRVVVNLVQNALAHGGEGVSVLVELLAPAVIRVSDTGPGIAEANRAQIFEPFFRHSKAPGSGLGLHLVQEIVQRHAGTITVGEGPGGGAEFVLRFPASDPDAATR